MCELSVSSPLSGFSLGAAEEATDERETVFGRGARVGTERKREKAQREAWWS